ncbi:hypothetical protein F441_18600 [Phytophthora nicotianae CJ01A1]|uniref:Uncharacterized protein n=5 Tax=Phytophthora nicotianae TaxID=4792 RepID=W2PJV7_PHYN3|nr:hypothetical protein PPTG_24110 [Phytophthora nicotianae INRA-310]ETI34842.1 hypothetical protein F443_18741 [Phytophthora nicotianae P1569]ETK75127.1 hypothetical protein L915_18223 [Phytophthora nicotianae]ETP04682.1 hypothetical protein F441_18600 [Phytophthora nicotianae CJ01A1]ETP32830.1 hypothetical protein F442_18554 [Phytophthora nicotianae P10297]ETL28553.1 hypothetical protein L916_18127 [Phytophthora nicotianae]
MNGNEVIEVYRCVLFFMLESESRSELLQNTDKDRVEAKISVLALRQQLLTMDHSQDPEQQDKTDHVHHALIRTTADLCEGFFHLFVDAFNYRQPIDHDGLLLQFFVQHPCLLT